MGRVLYQTKSEIVDEWPSVYRQRNGAVHTVTYRRYWTRISATKVWMLVRMEEVK